jgi:hypothetical protein
VTTPRRFVEILDRDAAKASDEQAPLLAAAYAKLFRAWGLRAARDLPARAVTAAASPGGAGWSPPDADEVYRQARAQADMQRTGDVIIRRVMAGTAAGALAYLNLDFTLTNPLMRGVLAQRGTKIVRITDEFRAAITASLDEAWQAGESIPQAAARLRALGVDQWARRAETISRTEIIGARNGASLAAARIAGVTTSKTWLSADDERVRETHQQADGQTVPTDQPFTVGDAQLMYPGDETGPPEETILCRCVLTYDVDEDAVTAAGDTIGGLMSAVENPRGVLRVARPVELAAAPAAAADAGAASWNGVLALEGVDTGDGRRVAPGAVSWRDLPLTLMAQTTTDVGHDGAQVAGRIDSIERDAEGRILGTGVFDSGEFGVEVARMVAERTLRGVSVDLSIEEFEIEETGVIVDDPFFGPYAETIMVVTKGTIMGATLTPFPAFESARVQAGDGDPVTAASLPFALGGWQVSDAAWRPSESLVAAVGALDRATLRERYEAYAVAIRAGMLTVDECRAIEGFPPLAARLRAPSDAERDAPLVAALQQVTVGLAEGRQVDHDLIDAVRRIAERPVLVERRTVRVERDADGVVTGYSDS